MKILLSCMLFLPIISVAQQREFNFYVDKKDSTLSLHITSLETFPCLGYSVKTFEMWDHDTLIVEIRGFIKPTKCYSVVDAARKNEKIIGLRSNRFGLRIRWKEKSDIWLLEVTKEDVIAKEKMAAFTSWFRD